MIELTKNGIIYENGQINESPETLQPDQKSEFRQNTIAYQILNNHNTSKIPGKLKLKFDSLVSHDITYVGIIQSARESGMKNFPVPYTMTNCHNSLCAIGGTINEDDHVYGLSAAKKYGGIYVPANFAVMHQFEREMMAFGGGMILGSDSHTRYGALGTLAIGEGGPELVKQLLQNTYDIDAPKVILVYLENEPRPGVGPHDVAIALIKAVFSNEFAKNRILEFVGPGVKTLPIDFRNGIDVMTTETTCLSSIWETDEKVKEYYQLHHRPDAYRKLAPLNKAYYDGMVSIDLAKIEPMIALPFHPSNAYPIRELLENAEEILRSVEDDSEKLLGNSLRLSLLDKTHDGKVYADQGIIAGCAGGMFDNLCAAADILDQGTIGNDFFSMSVYPSSMPVNAALTENGIILQLQKAGVVNKPAFCGPCFGAGDIPSNNGLSIRHTTRNFPNREGAKPDQGQAVGIALMDARSIAASAANGGALTPATDLDIDYGKYEYHFDPTIYKKRVYFGFGKGKEDETLRMGPNITNWPKMHPLAENLMLVLAAVIDDPVTTTDELIPSGETSSYRSNPLKLAEFTLSRRVPEYVSRAKAIGLMEQTRRDGEVPTELRDVIDRFGISKSDFFKNMSIGSVVYANKPGDGSAREQAASSQKVLGGAANIAREYATKRYRSNCINWGIVPFTLSADQPFFYQAGDVLYVPGIRAAIQEGKTSIPAKILANGRVTDLVLNWGAFTEDEKLILLSGSLMNYYADGHGNKEGK